MSDQMVKQCASCGNWAKATAPFCPVCGGKTFYLPQPSAPQYQQPQYDQTAYQQPQYGQQQYDPSSYQQPPYGQPQYDQTQYDQTQYQQPQYDQAQYQQPPYQQPQYVSPQGQGGQQKNKKKKSVLPLIIGLAAVVVIAVVAVVLLPKLTAKKTPSAPASSVSASDAVTETSAEEEENSASPAAQTDKEDKTITEADSPVVFKMIGNIRDEEFMPYNIIHSEEDNFVLCDPFGVNQLQRTFTAYSPIDAAKGIYMVTSDAAEPNNIGLVNTNGKIYIPCETAGIKRINERFIRVFYGTRQVENEDEALFFITDRSFAMRYSKEDGDRLYAGNIRIYDLVEEKFLDNINIEDASYAIYGLTENFFIYDEKERVSKVYGVDGREITGFPKLGFLTTNVDYVTAKVNEETVVYDQNANELFRVAEKNISKVFGGSYYSKYEDGGYHLFTSEGKPVVNQTFTSIDGCGDLFICGEKKGDDIVYGVIDGDGNTVLPFSASSINKNKPCTGFLWARIADQEHSFVLIYPDGSSVSVDEILNYGTYFAKKDNGDSFSVSVIAQKQFVTLEAQSIDPVGNFCLSVKDASGLRYLLDSFSGKQLTPVEYTNIAKGSNDCIYAQRADDKSWDVFTVHENDYATAQRVRATLLNALEDAFRKEGIAAEINKETGEIALDSAVLFELDKAELLSDGKAFLTKFMKAFTGVVFDGGLDGYVDSVLIEGHTDSDGTQEHNLELSQARSDVVRDFCLSPECGGEKLADMLDSVGVASSRPVLNADGTENKEASRRVSFTLIIVTTEFESQES